MRSTREASEWDGFICTEHRESTTTAKGEQMMHVKTETGKGISYHRYLVSNDRQHRCLDPCKEL